MHRLPITNGGRVMKWTTNCSALVRWQALALGIAVFAPVSGAQAQEDLEMVVVTGSRIRQNALNQPAPLVTVDEADIAKSGLTSVGDLLQRLPVSGGGLNTKFNTSGNVGFPPDGGGVGAGAATADLRHLGPKRTLVLVDGIRWVNESSASGASSATDLNTIPTSIIDHIEVLQDGASAIYGSDAIAGVINIITKKSFEGIEFSGYTGAYDEGDGETGQFNISAGATSESTKAFFGLSYLDQRRVSSADREISEFPTRGVRARTGRCSSGIPQGRFLFFDPRNVVLDPDGNPIPLDITLNSDVTGAPNYDFTLAPDAANRTDDYHNFATEDRFNFQPFNLITTPSERIGLYGQVETQLSDNVSVYVKGLFNNRNSTNQAAPEPIFVGPGAGNGFNSPLDITEISVDNPYNPFGIDLDLVNGVVVTRRPLEGGPRIFEQNVNTWYVGGGFRGDFTAAERDFYWDVNAVWSRNRADQTTHGSYNSLKIKNALGPGTAAGVNGATATACGEVTVVAGVPTVLNPIPNCVPFNIFGGQAGGAGTITEDMLGYIQPTLHDNSEQELKDFTANITGTIIPLPAGGLNFAVGVEHRKQSGFYEPDAIYPANESAGVPSGPAEGEFDVDEVYGEIQVPILKDAPLADLLQLSAAIRWFDYSTFGSDTTTKFGLNWRPMKDLLVRGTFGEGFRAPGIGELFGTFSRFDATLDDVLGLHGGESGRAHGPAAGGGAGELPGARRAGELHADQPADFCHHRRQRGAGARGVGRLHGGPGLEPGLCDWCVVVGSARVRAHLLQHLDRQHDPGARCPGKARRLRGDARQRVVRRHYARRQRHHRRVRKYANQHRRHRYIRLRPEHALGPADDRSRSVHLQLAEHHPRRVYRQGADRERAHRRGARGHGAWQPVHRLPGVEVRADSRLEPG